MQKRFLWCNWVHLIANWQMPTSLGGWVSQPPTEKRSVRPQSQWQSQRQSTTAKLGTVRFWWKIQMLIMSRAFGSCLIFLLLAVGNIWRMAQLMSKAFFCDTVFLVKFSADAANKRRRIGWGDIFLHFRNVWPRFAFESHEAKSQRQEVATTSATCGMSCLAKPPCRGRIKGMMGNVGETCWWLGGCLPFLRNAPVPKITTNQPLIWLILLRLVVYPILYTRFDTSQVVV